MFSQFQQNKPLSPLCTFGIGGPARYYVEVKDFVEMQRVLTFLHEQKQSYFILGKGSNCLFDSNGLDTVVIHNKIDFLEEIEPGHFYVGAGFSFSLLGTQSAKKGWGGLEFAAGIPASVGGAVFMNAGAQGCQTWQTLAYVDFVDDEGNLKRLKKEELTYRYRYSSFQEMRGAIVAACFILSEQPAARKTQLQLLEARIQSQPYHEKSAGCVFKNPTCKNAPCGAAGQLIDRCGLKGFSIGGAKVSEMHANFLVNTGEATSQDVRDLIEHVREEVKRQTAVILEPEIYWIHDGRTF